MVCGWLCSPRADASLRSVILSVAERTAGVDADALAEAIDDGRARRAVMDDFAEATGDTVQGSPHLFLPGGTAMHNPGVEMRWEGEKGKGFPVVESDRPGVYADLLRLASAGRERRRAARVSGTARWAARAGAAW